MKIADKIKTAKFKCSKCKYILHQTYQLTNEGVEVFIPKCTKCGHQTKAEDIIVQPFQKQTIEKNKEVARRLKKSPPYIKD